MTARTTAILVNGDVDAERVERAAEQPEPPERHEQADAGDGGRQHERKLDQRHDEIARPGRPRGHPVRGGGAEHEDQGHRDEVRLES